MTDAIITWVNGQDPQHNAKWSHYLQQEQGDGVPHEANAAVNTRFNECGELYFNILLIRKNAPWIERIYLVTDNQRPHWLTETEADRLGVEIVDHKVIFSGFEECLPTFNSMSISSMFHRIPNLDSDFLYLNDDVFILRPVVKEEYFQNGQPIFRAHREIRNAPWPFLKRPAWQSERKPDIGIVRLRLGREKVLFLKMERLSLYHSPHPVSVQSYLKLMNKRIAKNIQFRFRSPEQFEPISLYANLLLQQKGCRFVGSDVAYFDPQYTPELTVESIRKLADQAYIRHACFQSLDEYGESSRQAAFDFLEECVAA